MAIDTPKVKPASERRKERLKERRGLDDSDRDLAILDREHKDKESDREKRIRSKLRLKKQKQDLAKENMELRRQNIEAQIAANTDELTGLPKRNRIELDLERRVQQLDEKDVLRRRAVDNVKTPIEGIPLNSFSVMFIDVDEFKSVNDELTHQIGDDTIKDIANLIKSNVREGDLAGRVGGDEFVVLVDESSGGCIGAKRLANGIIEGIHKINEHLKDKYNFSKSIGVSVGICSSDEYDGSPEKLIQLADKAMYEAKDLGKNNIAIASRSEYNDKN